MSLPKFILGQMDHLEVLFLWAQIIDLIGPTKQLQALHSNGPIIHIKPKKELKS